MRPELTDTAVTLAGELCTPKDVLARDVPVSRIRVGDIVCFDMAGAYGWDISHHDFLRHAHPNGSSSTAAGDRMSPADLSLLSPLALRPTEETIPDRIGEVIALILDAQAWTQPICVERETLAVLDGHHRLPRRSSSG